MAATQTLDPPRIPDHVPPELVLPIQITDGEDFLRAPHEYMAKLHEIAPPIFYRYTPELGVGMWTLIKHADALFMLRRSELFSNRSATPFPRDPDYPFQFIPIEIDPPDHRKYRNIVDPVLTPQAVLKLEDTIRKLANDLIDKVIDQGECEFTTAYSRPLPVSIFLNLMGLPLSMTDTFVAWVVDLLHSQSYEIMAQTMKVITAYLKEAIAEKTKNPDDAVISRIVHAKPNGIPLTEPEIFGFVIFLFIAGLDTVFATLNNVWLWLAEHPERRHEIISRPNDIDNIVEELLRVYSVTFSGRTVEQDLELRGIKMKKGDRINAILPAANYDPEVFPNPRKVDFDRPRKTVLAFTVGVHSCMGAHLARLEIKIALQEWLRRIPDFSVKPGTKIVYRPGGVVGPEYLPLVW
jgi:cytochrome P450